MSERDDQYKPWRVSLDGMRLTCQHMVWREHLGYNLSPAIQFRESEPIHIADVAAGTCLWSMQLAEELGDSCQIEASDMNLNLCPPDVLLPSNMRIRKWSFFDPVPTEWIGRFDVVHVRLLVVVFANHGDPHPVLKALVSMLRPGGYLQWDEYDYDLSGSTPKYVADVVRFPNPRVSHPAAIQLWQKVIGGLNSDIGFFAKLDDRLRAAGLEDISEDRTPQPKPTVIRAFYEYWLGWANQMAELFEKIKPDEAQELWELIQHIERDQQEDGVIFYPVTRVMVGRKGNIVMSDSSLS